MELLGALLAGVSAFFAAGLAIGKTPQIRLLPFPITRPVINQKAVWLRQAGLKLTPTKYIALLGFFAAGVFVVISYLTMPIVAAIPTAIAAVVPHVLISRRRLRHLTKVQQAWPDAITQLIESLETNALLESALIDLSRNGPEPIRSAFEPFPILAATIGVVPALEIIKDRLTDPKSDQIIEVLILSYERGSQAVVEVLQKLSQQTNRSSLVESGPRIFATIGGRL